MTCQRQEEENLDHKFPLDLGVRRWANNPLLGKIFKKLKKVTDFMGSRNQEEDMVENRHIWRLSVDGRLTAI